MAAILVTGGAGYIGSHTAHLLKRHGYDVIIVDDLSRGHEHNVRGFPFHKLRMQDTAALTELLRNSRIEAVIHFAAYIAVGESTKVPELYFSNNTGGTLSLLTAMVDADVSKIVFSSTAAVYGMPQTVPIPETSPYSPLSPYGDSKVMVEKILDWMDQFRALRSVCLRYFNACGADAESGLGEEHDPETHLIPLLLRAVTTGAPITLFGDDYPTADGTCIRDYIHVMDLADAHLLALRHLLNGGESQRFNVGTGSGYSVREVLSAVEEVTGKKVPFVMGPRREGDAPVLVANSDKLKSTLGWRPRYTDVRDIVRSAWEFDQRQARP
ncbi:MAG: UDP-glucose 4-epimerase GalE [Bryobacteraceae bacterium]|jgi:UDP-glucose-4-epimerase GalE